MRRGNLTRPVVARNEVTWQSHPPRRCEERSDVAISFFCFFLYKNLKMRSSSWKALLMMTNERHPPRRKTAPLQGGELLYYSPIEGGFKGGGCAFIVFCLITFLLFLNFQDRPSCCIATPDEDENTYLNPSLRGDQPFFGWTTWQSLPSTLSF
jgi:hypothetical protein